jgi:hypothetical protein
LALVVVDTLHMSSPTEKRIFRTHRTFAPIAARLSFALPARVHRIAFTQTSTPAHDDAPLRIGPSGHFPTPRGMPKSTRGIRGTTDSNPAKVSHSTHQGQAESHSGTRSSHPFALLLTPQPHRIAFGRFRENPQQTRRPQKELKPRSARYRLGKDRCHTLF